MRRLPPLALLLLAGCSGSAPPPPAPADDGTLKVGRPAPPLAVTQWLQGEPVAGFRPGTVYALDFWASWCGPCVQAMPHVQQVADEFAGRAVVVGVTAPDDRNPLAAVVQVLGRTKADRHQVRHAAVSRDTLRAYSVTALPTAVVVGADGRVAYIGSPLLLGEVLDRVLAGTWEGAASAGAVEAAADDLDRLLTAADRNPAAALPRLAAFERSHPGTAGRPPFRVAKVAVLLATGRADEAKAVTEELLPQLVARTDVQHLSALRAVWGDPRTNRGRQHPELAVRAAEAVLGIEGDADPVALVGLADAHLFAGDKAKARELADKALAAAPDGSAAKKWLAEQRKRFE